MDEILKELIKTLPKSPTTLDETTVEKIYRYIPVPTDYKILWADIVSFGGYPAGVVITERAIIVKASREEAKNNKTQIKEENKKLEEFNNTPVSELIDESLRITPREKKEPKQTKKANTNDNMQSLNF